MTYLAVKDLHLIGIVTWFAGLFYIFRLYVYHVENSHKREIAQVLEAMERRLYRMIMTPAMIFAVAMGAALIYQNPHVMRTGWFGVKALCLVPLFAYHFFAGHVRKRFLKGDFFLSSRQCRLINEVPTLVLLVVIPLAVIKPF